MKSWQWAIIALVLTAAAAILIYKGCNYKPDILPVAKTDTVVRWLAKDSLYVASLITQKDQEYSNMDKAYRDSISSLVSINKKQAKKINELVVAFTSAEAEVNVVGEPDISYEQPVNNCPPVKKSMTQRFKNKWYDITATVGQGARARIMTTDTLIVQRKTVTTGNFFNQRQYEQLDISFANPYNVVTGVKSYVVTQPKPKKFSISLFAGYGYGLDKELKRLPIVGVGVSYNIIRF